MQIRHAGISDIERIMHIYSRAREFMAATGNPDQWGKTNWPPEELIRSDISSGNCYVCVDGENVVGTFFFCYGKDIEPTYNNIEDGAWLDDSPYGVIHRIASDGSVHGVGSCVIEWAWQKCPHLRIDTHGDNIVMQNLLAKNGFVRCGTIYVEQDDAPRLAYEKTAAVHGAV